MSEPVRRALRTLMQLVASGALTVIVNQLAGGLTPEQAGLVLMVWQVVVTFCHNWLEDNTAFPSVLKAPSNPPDNPPDEPT